MLLLIESQFLRDGSQNRIGKLDLSCRSSLVPQCPCRWWQCRADINDSANDGNTALMDAAAGGHTETVKVLLARGANISAKNKNGQTALLKAVEKGVCEAAQLLLANDTTLNAGDDTGRAILKLAEDGRCSTVVESLKEKEIGAL